MKELFVRASLGVLMLSLAWVGASAQTQTPTPTPETDDVVKITTKLVQFDAVVTDKDGKQVSNLRAEDFVILQDGKPQKITSFSYVNTDPGTAAAGRVNAGSSTSVQTAGAEVPPMRVANGGGRVITLVVDDGNCRTSQIGLAATRDGIEKFIKEQMLPADMVAIYQTRSGSSMFQQYTSDKAQLIKAVRKIRYYPAPLGCDAHDGSFYNRAEVPTFDKLDIETGSTKTIKIESDTDRAIRENNEDTNQSAQVVGTIGVLRYILRGLDRASGRKVVFLFSDGLTMRDRKGKSTGALSVLRDLTEMANRASVVFNTIDTRGLFDPTMIESRDAVSTRDDALASETSVRDRDQTTRLTREGLHFLANETGGRFYMNQNRLENPVKQALALEKGYYLLAYEPDENTFKDKKFNNIEIKVNQPDLKVISRAGFIGTEAENAKRKKRSADSDLYEALVAPLPSAGMNMRLTAFYGNTAAAGNFVRSLIHLDGDAVKFVPEKNQIKAVFDVVAVTMNEKNEVVDEFSRTHTFKIDPGAMPYIRQHGVIYTTDVAIKKPGTYNFRVAFRDATTKMLGSASQVVTIPDLKKGRLETSALTVSEIDKEGKFIIPSAATPDNALAMSQSNAVPAIRQFRRGSILAYSYVIYNAKLGSDGKPAITTQLNLYHDGKLIMEGKPAPADLGKQPDWSRITDHGYLRLLQQAPAGDYTLQVIVRDTLAKGDAQVSSQWVDFETAN